MTLNDLIDLVREPLVIDGWRSIEDIDKLDTLTKVWYKFTGTDYANGPVTVSAIVSSTTYKNGGISSYKIVGT